MSPPTIDIFLSLTYTALITLSGIYPKNETSTLFEATSSSFFDGGSTLFKTVLVLSPFFLVTLQLIPRKKNSFFTAVYGCYFVLCFLIEFIVTLVNWKKKLSLVLSILYLDVSLGFVLLLFIPCGDCCSNLDAPFKELDKSKQNSIFSLIPITKFDLTNYGVQLLFAGAEAVLFLNWKFIPHSGEHYSKHIEALLQNVATFTELSNGLVVASILFVGVFLAYLSNCCCYPARSFRSSFCPLPALFSCLLAIIQFNVYVFRFDLGNYDLVFKLFHLVLVVFHIGCYIFHMKVITTGSDITESSDNQPIGSYSDARSRQNNGRRRQTKLDEYDEY